LVNIKLKIETMTNEVIDWAEAMAQLDDDEEFLRELLVDFLGEIEEQAKNIEGALQSETLQPENYHLLKRGSHVIKGGAANLMCKQLAFVSADLELMATEMMQRDVIVGKYQELRFAIENYKAMLGKLGV